MPTDGARPTVRLFEFADVWLGTPSARGSAPGSRHRAVRLADLAAGLPADLRLRSAELDPRRVLPKQELCAGDLLVGARGTKLNAAVVRAAHAGAYATENLIVVRLRTAAPVLPEYLALLLEHGGMAEELAGRSSNPEVGIRILSPRELGEWMVPLAPLAEQRELASVLTATRRAIRAADEANRARRDVLYALAQEIVGPLARRDSGDGDDE
jgi:hypothetical protein